jgi:hypothetical protein
MYKIKLKISTLVAADSGACDLGDANVRTHFPIFSFCADINV